MRRYDWPIPEEEWELFRSLTSSWTGWTKTDESVSIELGEGRGVDVYVRARNCEPKFDCFRIAVRPVVESSPNGESAEFGTGRNVVTLLRAEEWVAPTTSEKGLLGRVPMRQESGALGSAPPNAVAVCQTVDGILFQGAAGEELLVRCGWPPYSIAVIRDSEDIKAIRRDRAEEPVA